MTKTLTQHQRIRILKSLTPSQQKPYDQRLQTLLSEELLGQVVRGPINWYIKGARVDQYFDAQESSLPEVKGLFCLCGEPIRVQLELVSPDQQRVLISVDHLVDHLNVDPFSAQNVQRRLDAIFTLMDSALVAYNSKKPQADQNQPQTTRLATVAAVKLATTPVEKTLPEPKPHQDLQPAMQNYANMRYSDNLEGPQDYAALQWFKDLESFYLTYLKESASKTFAPELLQAYHGLDKQMSGIRASFLAAQIDQEIIDSQLTHLKSLLQHLPNAVSTQVPKFTKVSAPKLEKPTLKKAVTPAPSVAPKPAPNPVWKTLGQAIGIHRNYQTHQQANAYLTRRPTIHLWAALDKKTPAEYRDAIKDLEANLFARISLAQQALINADLIPACIFVDRQLLNLCRKLVASVLTATSLAWFEHDVKTIEFLLQTLPLELTQTRTGQKPDEHKVLISETYQDVLTHATLDFEVNSTIARAYSTQQFRMMKVLAKTEAQPIPVQFAIKCMSSVDALLALQFDLNDPWAKTNAYWLKRIAGIQQDIDELTA